MFGLFVLPIAEAIGAALAAALAPLIENFTRRACRLTLAESGDHLPSMAATGRGENGGGPDDGLLVCHRRHRIRCTEVGGLTRQCHHHGDENDGEVDEAGVGRTRAFPRKLYSILSETCKGEPYRMAESPGFGQGSEAWRILLRRYASKAPGTKRALLQALLTMQPANSVESFGQLLLNLQEMFRRYDGMAENQMPEDIRCPMLVACCPKDLKEYFDMSSENFVCSDLRVKANTWMERKCDQQLKNLQQLESHNHQGPTPMELGAAQWRQEEWEDHASQDSQDWSGYPDASHQSCMWHENQLSEEMSFVPWWKE